MPTNAPPSSVGQGAPVPGTAPPAGRGPRIVLAVLITLALVGLGAGTGVLLHQSGRGYPDRWDPRIVPIVHFVEQHRGLRYLHPVRVYFLTASQYHRASVGDDSGGPDKQSRTAAREVAELRAFGLVQGNPDLYSADKDLADSGTLAFYDQDTKVVNVRGSKFTPALRVTLAHELTHALQDQHFDLTHQLDTDDSERATAVRSVVEGDAVSVENAYEASMSASDQAAYERESTSSSSEAEGKLSNVPDVLSTLFGLPYALGSAFIDLVDAGRGQADLSRTDELFRRMPADTSELFNPIRYFSDAHAAKVDPPKGFAGKQVEHDKFGAAFLFVMLSERIDPARAMSAVDGWDGDGYRAVEVKTGATTRLCVSAEFHTSTTSGGAALRSALTDWSHEIPAGSDPVVAGTAEDVTLRVCDPGKTAAMHLTGASSDALAYPVVRGQLASSNISEGLPRDQALCVSTKVVSKLSLADLQATTLTPELEQRISSLSRSALASC